MKLRKYFYGLLTAALCLSQLPGIVYGQESIVTEADTMIALPKETIIEEDTEQENIEQEVMGNVVGAQVNPLEGTALESQQVELYDIMTLSVFTHEVYLGDSTNSQFGNNSNAGGVKWTETSAEAGHTSAALNVPAQWKWMLFDWRDTYGSTAFYNSDGTPIREMYDTGHIIANWNTSYVSKIYNYSQYKEMNADVNAQGWSDTSAWAHFIQHGLDEGRTASYSFNPNEYRTLYTDLANIYGNSMWYYYAHYAQYGNAEGRWGMYNWMVFNSNGGSCATSNMLTCYGKQYGTTPTNHNVSDILPVASRSGYTFDGWYTSPSGGTRIDINAICPYYTDFTVYAHWTAIPNRSYKVYHYQQNVSGSGYTLAETQSLSAQVGSTVKPAVKSYTGFTAPSTQSVQVVSDGTTAVRYYYSRNKYSVTVSGDTGTGSVSGGGSYYYGAKVNLSISPKAGYSISSVNASSGISNPYAFTMPAGNVTVSVVTTKIPVTVSVPLQLIMGDGAEFVIQADNTAGTVFIGVPEQLVFIQANKNQTINGKVSLSDTTLTSDRHSVTGVIETDGFTAGSWSTSFTIHISYALN